MNTDIATGKSLGLSPYEQGKALGEGAVQALAMVFSVGKTGLRSVRSGVPTGSGLRQGLSLKARASHGCAFELYKAYLRHKMQRPNVADPRLGKLLGELYRENATLGSGSTADAIRVELVFPGMRLVEYSIFKRAKTP